MITETNKADTSKARLYHSNGLVQHFEDQSLAYAIWLGARKGQRIAFRGAGDTRPVYSWDYVDRF